MRFFCLFIFSLTANILSAQNPVLIYIDRDGKPVTDKRNASAFYRIDKENDRWKKSTYEIFTGKLKYAESFKDEACTISDGPYEMYNRDEELVQSGNYVDDKKEGAWKAWADKRLIDSAFYKNGYISGIRLRWNEDGSIADSSIFEENGVGVGRGYWRPGVLSQQGKYAGGKKEGQWTYYYKTGIKCQEVLYQADSAVSFTCYTESGEVQTKYCVYEKEANFAGGEKAWRKYLERKLSEAKYPKDYYKGRISGTALIQFVVDKDGTIKDLKVVKSAHPALDVVALEILRDSPNWEPAVQYNRKVKAYRLQPITFATMEE